MDEFYIGAVKKVILIIVAAIITVSGMIVYELYKSSVIGMLVVIVGIFLFFWTIFL